MYSTLTVEDLGDLIEIPQLAVLATYRRDGRLILSPLWWEWRDGSFVVPIFSDDFKLKHVKNDPRATIVLAENSLPYRGIEVSGTAKIVTEPGALERFRRMAHRFVGVEAGDAMIVHHNDDDLQEVRIEGAVRCWNLDTVFPS